MWLLIRRLYCLNPNFSVLSSRIKPYVNDSASQEPKPTFLVGQQETLLEQISRFEVMLVILNVLSVVVCMFLIFYFFVMET